MQAHRAVPKGLVDLACSTQRLQELPARAVERRLIAEAHLLLLTADGAIVLLEEGYEVLHEALTTLVEDGGDLVEL